MVPKLTKGGDFTDNRGTLFFNNDFDASLAKRIYVITNQNINFVRGWQGHNIEKRWFLSITGEFTIFVKKMDDSQEEAQKFLLSSDSLDVLYVPNGYLTAIISDKKESKLMVMSDYHLNEINDDIRKPYIK